MSQLVVRTVKKLRKLALKRPKTDQTADSGQKQVDCSVERLLLERRFFRFEKQEDSSGCGYGRIITFQNQQGGDVTDVTRTVPFKGWTRKNVLKKASLKRLLRFI